METDKNSWHLDKRVPIALIVTLAAQTLGIAWWAATLETKQAQMQQDIAELRRVEAVRTLDDRRIAEALARLDERLRALAEILQRLDRRSNP